MVITVGCAPRRAAWPPAGAAGPVGPARAHAVPAAPTHGRRRLPPRPCSPTPPLRAAAAPSSPAPPAAGGAYRAGGGGSRTRTGLPAFPHGRCTARRDIPSAPATGRQAHCAGCAGRRVDRRLGPPRPAALRLLSAPRHRRPCPARAGGSAWPWRPPSSITERTRSCRSSRRGACPSPGGAVIFKSPPPTARA